MTLIRCRIKRLAQLTSSVKQITLESKENKFSFRPGQWVDFFPPNFENPGGYSISSSPADSELELAIREGSHPVVRWIYEDAREGDQVSIQVGGDWFLKRRKNEQKNLLLIAGGVGINPILSMLRHLSVDDDGWESITLIYSGRHWDDVLYKDESLLCLESLPQLKIKIHLTNQDFQGNLTDSRRVTFRLGRLSREVVRDFDNSETVSYLCGPPAMSDEVSSWMAKAEVNYEKRW
ncbi:unnamed protein product [Oikopleura dioica]|uniref:Oxidoreductase NAD-binding domain-containing protein 1 n=1 Tax=Oikopleura dioica TaxID=34765 RepID=E4YQK7_OIKDI|nr:unnamed protein product [Oikopleura dioica]